MNFMRFGFFSLCLIYVLLPATSHNLRADSLDEGFVRASGTNFFVHGKPFHYAGSNCYYLMVYAAGQYLSDVDEVLEEAQVMGLRVIRTWAFNDGPGWNSLQLSPGVYDENVFKGLDYVIDQASQRGLRVILPLVNNWTDYGGMDQYVSWSDTARFHDDFYTDENTRRWYKNHMYTLIHRVNTFNGRTYRDDPTIFAWELANEPRCPSDRTGNTLLSWIEEMSAYAKSLDPNHMVTTGIEGFYNDSSGPWYLNGFDGVDFIRDHQVQWIDFATAHSWPDNWGLDFQTIMDLVTRQVTDAHGTIGKPFVLEEFGKLRDGSTATGSENHYDPRTYFSPGVETYQVRGASPIGTDHSLPADFPLTEKRAATTERDQLFAAYSDILLTHGAGGSNYWIAYHDAYPDYDGYGVYYPEDASTIAIITEHAEAMNELSGRCQTNLNVSVSTNQTRFAPGETLVATLVVENPGDVCLVDFFFGVLLPDQNTIVYFSDLSFHTGIALLSDLSALRPIAGPVNLSRPFSVNMPSFFSYTFSGAEVSGNYTLFLAVATDSAFANGRLDNGELVILDTAPFTFTQ